MDWYRQWRRDQRAGIHYHPLELFRPVQEGSSLKEPVEIPEDMRVFLNRQFKDND